MLRSMTPVCRLTALLTLAAGLTAFTMSADVAAKPAEAGAIESADPLASPVTVEVADLKQQLESGLRARRPAEFAFVEVVVEMVENDNLPLVLVKSTFVWARKKGAKTRYPFPYFERGLRLRAARQGINIP